jgi:hypothetical protein
MATKPEMIVMPAHPTNTWDRYGQPYEFIVMHYVGGVSTARNNGDYYGNTPYIGASAHFFVDERDIVYSCPLTRSAGHCGVDYSGGKAPFWRGKGVDSTNRRSIGIEMCCKKDSRGVWYIEPETVNNAVKLVRWLMEEFNIDADHVIRHYDVCWKTCPEPWVRDVSQWIAFKMRIKEDEIDMTEERLRQIVREEIRNVAYGDIKDVPDYWEGKIDKLLQLKTIDGGTPEEVDATDVNMTFTEAKMAAIFVRTFDTVFPGAIEAAIERVKEAEA